MAKKFRQQLTVYSALNDRTLRVVCQSHGAGLVFNDTDAWATKGRKHEWGQLEWPPRKYRITVEEL